MDDYQFEHIRKLKENQNKIRPKTQDHSIPKWYNTNTLVSYYRLLQGEAHKCEGHSQNAVSDLPCLGSKLVFKIGLKNGLVYFCCMFQTSV